MLMDSFFPWAIAFLACIFLALSLVMSASASKRQLIEVDALRDRVLKLEETNEALRDTAARLPDMSDRASRAETESEARLQRLNDISQMNAALQANERSLVEKIEGLEVNLASERSIVSEIRNDIQLAHASLSAAEADIRAKNSVLGELREHNSQLKDSHETISANLMQALQKTMQAEADRDAARDLQQRTHQFLAEAQAALRTSFTEAASRVFDEKSLSLEQKIAASADASKMGLQTTLQPFSEHILQFQQRLETITNENTKARSELSGKIDALVNLNQNMAVAADSLTKALKGNAKARGNWGEMVLDSVLAASGLVEGSNYFRQQSGRDEETGNRFQPDVVVALPDRRKVVIDSKVSLIAWTEAVNTDNKEEEAAALQRHVASLRLHVRQLAEKNYPALYSGEALEITIAFVPIEAALSKALEISPELQREAFEKGIAFATPNTLMAMMQVVERLWVRDGLQKQVAAIGDEAAKLLDSVSSFLSDFDSVEQSFSRADKQLKLVRSKMETSPQSVLARARRLISASTRGKKKLHASLMVAADEQDALPLLGDAATGSMTEERSEDGDGTRETN